MKILIIADDLTGALDSSVAFSGRGLTVLCALSPAHVAEAIKRDPDVLCISTNTREETEEQAIKALVAIQAHCDHHPEWLNAILLKKVDSRLKGHVAAEVAFLAQNRTKVAVTPAIPRLGRFVKSGAICGAGIPVPIDVAKTSGRPSGDIINCATDADIDDAIADMPQDTLFVGAAGLAEALARRFTPLPTGERMPDLEAPALFAIGSRDPITLDQVAALLDCRDNKTSQSNLRQQNAAHVPIDITHLKAPNGVLGTTAHQKADCLLLQLTPGQETINVQTAAASFATSATSLVKSLCPGTLLASGGETAAAIARQLGCGLLRVEGEVLPGLPLSTMVDGRPGLKVITKSGGFGTRETLVKVAGNLLASPVDSF